MTESKSANRETKALVNKDGDVTKLTEWATEEVNSIEDMKRLFDQQGVSYSSGEEVTGDYKLIRFDEKQRFLERISAAPVFIVRWEFRKPNGGTEFVSVWIMVEGFGKFIVNDSSKGGFYGQLGDITSFRLENGWPSGKAHAGVDVPRGFKRNNPFYYDSRTNKSISKGDLESVPEEFKRLATPTWRLEL
jgi:hypothetical protein